MVRTCCNHVMRCATEQASREVHCTAVLMFWHLRCATCSRIAVLRLVGLYSPACCSTEAVAQDKEAADEPAFISSTSLWSVRSNDEHRKERDRTMEQAAAHWQAALAAAQAESAALRVIPRSCMHRPREAAPMTYFRHRPKTQLRHIHCICKRVGRSNCTCYAAL